MTENKPRVLFVDDEANLLAGLQRQFRRDFDLLTASSGAEGLEKISAAGPFAVVVSDYAMPGMNGVEFLRQAHERSPETVGIMLTGQSELEVAVDALREGRIFRFLRKPCPAELLRRTIVDALEQYRLITAEQRLSRELSDANNQLRGLNDHLEQTILERTATIRQLHQFVTGLNGLELLEDVAQHVVDRTAEMLQSHRVSLMVPGHGREYLTILAATGVPEEIVRSARVPIGRSICGRVFAQAESILVNDESELGDYSNGERHEYLEALPCVSALLAAPTGPVGVLNVTGHAGALPYGADDLANIRAIAENASIALCNQMRLAERNEARDAINLAMAKLAEQRDPETGQHLERVRAYCRLLGTILAGRPGFGTVTRSFIDSLYRCSPLHDIGKVGIPDAVLLKPGKLTDAEFEIMKRHAAIGGDTIRAVIEKGRSQDFLQVAMEIAYYHHEKYDGSGYPHGLKGNDIPLSARIMALADVYDALTSRRVYKPAFPHERAVSIIREGAGRHFDPDVAAAFLERHEEFAAVALELADPVGKHGAVDAVEESDPLAADHLLATI